MDARRPSSTKWTEFPSELTEQIVDVFTQNFQSRIPNADFIAEGRIYPEEVILRVGYRTPNQLRQDNFEASVDYNPKTLNADQMIFRLVDLVGAFLDGFLEAMAKDEDLDLPRIWQKHSFNDITAYLRYSTVNTELEAEADRLLGITQDELVKDQEASEDALDHAPMKVKITKKKDDTTH